MRFTADLDHEDPLFLDVFKIHSNNRTILHITEPVGPQVAILHSDNVNIFEVITYNSPKQKKITITLSTLNGKNYCFEFG